MRVLLAVVSVAAGVSLTVAAALLIASMNESIRDLHRQLAGPAALRVVGPLARAGLDEAVTEKVAAVSGVKAAVPMVQATAIAEKRNGREITVPAIGVDCRVEALVGAFGCDARALRPPRGNSPVVMSSFLASELGDGAVIRTNTGRFSMDSVAVNDTLDETNGGRVVFYELDTAQRVFNRSGRIDAIYVQPNDGVDVASLQERIQEVVGAWNNVLRRDELGALDLGTGPLLSILGLLAIMAMGFSGLLVYNIVSLSLAERRREFALAGGVGAAPRAITAGILGEAALLGLLGGAFGSLAGIGFGAFVVEEANAAVVEQGSGLDLGLYVSLPVLVAGVLLGAITSLAASYVPARRARHGDLAAEIHGRAQVDEKHGRGELRLVIFLVGGAGTFLLSYIGQRNGALERWQPPLAAFAIVAMAVLLFAAVGAAAPLLLRFALRPLRATGGSLRLAVANLVANPKRTSVMAAAAGVTVGLACVLGSTGPGIRTAVRANAGEAADGRLWVSTLPANNAGTLDARPSPRLLEALASVPGVERVEQGPCVFLADDAGSMGVCAHNGTRTMPWDVFAGSVAETVLDRGEAILGAGAARSRGLRPGSTLRLPTPTRFADLRVAGIWSNSNFNGYSVTVSPRRFEELFGREQATHAFLRPRRGVSVDELARRVDGAKLDPDLYTRTPDEFALQLADEINSQVTPFWALQRVLLFVALVATLSTLLLVGVQRRRELGVLGAVGFGPGGLARMTISEATGAALAGALLAAVASLGVLQVFSNATSAAVGFRAPYAFDVKTAGVAIVLAVFVVTVGGLLPAWRTSRIQIVEAIRDE